MWQWCPTQVQGKKSTLFFSLSSFSLCVCVKKLFSLKKIIITYHALILQCVATMSYSSTWQIELSSSFLMCKKLIFFFFFFDHGLILLCVPAMSYSDTWLKELPLSPCFLIWWCRQPCTSSYKASCLLLLFPCYPHNFPLSISRFTEHWKAKKTLSVLMIIYHQSVCHAFTH